MMIKIRRARPEDLEGYLAMQEAAWKGSAVSREQALSRFANCPEGILIAEDRGKMVGTTTAIRLANYDFKHPQSWYKTTDDGLCTTHDPNGRIAFGVDLSAKLAVADALLVACLQIVIAEGIQYAVLGGRMPGFARYKRKHPDATADGYLFTRRANGHFLDPEVHMYSQIPGFRPIRAIPDYFEDPMSENYGVLLRWKNPFYGIPGRRKYISRFPFAAYQAMSIWRERNAFWFD